MATLALGSIGALIGGLVGGPSGALLGWNVGALVGGVVSYLGQPKQELGKLDDLRVTGSSYGSAIASAYGATRVGGTIIWALDLAEHHHDEGGKGGGPSARVYTYTCSFAVSVCRGPIAGIRRMWAEDVLIWDSTQSPPSRHNIHEPYLGTEDQLQDTLMVSFIGVNETPAYRGQAYVVFEDLDLTDWGNRLPSLSFELDPGPSPLLVSDVLNDLATQVGLEPGVDYDFSDANDAVAGYLEPGRKQAYQVAEPLLAAFATDMVEVDGRLVAVRRGAPTAVVVPASDMGARDWSQSSDPPERVRTTRKSDLSLPFKVEFSYLSPDRLYEQSVQAGIRHSRQSVQDQKTVGSLITMGDAAARKVADMLLDQDWSERVTHQFSVGPKWLALGPATPMLAEIGEALVRLRVLQMDMSALGQLVVTAVEDASTGATGPVSGYRSQLPSAPHEPVATGSSAVVPTVFDAWSGPELRDADGSAPGFYVVATGAVGWQGCTVYYSADGLHWTPGPVVRAKSNFGFATSALADGSAPGAVDAVSFGVQLHSTGALASAAAADVANGVNAALAGEEVAGFKDVAAGATPLAYTLSNVTRGRRGSPMSGHAPGERFWHLTEAVSRVSVDPALVGETVHVRCVSPGQTVSDVADVDVVIAANTPPYATPDDVAGAVAADGLSVERNGAGLIGPTKKLNLIEGANVTITEAASGDHIDVTIAATGGGGGGPAAAWHDGSGPPGVGLGADGDYYLDDDPSSGDVSAKAGGAWSVVTNIKGPPGADGADGAPGVTGAVLELAGGYTPSLTGADPDSEVVVPYAPDGTTPVTWAVKRIQLRVKGAGGAPSVRVEKSTASGAFSAATVGDVTLSSGSYEGDQTASLGTVASGDKLRANYLVLGTALGWSVQVTLEAP